MVEMQKLIMDLLGT